MVLILLLFLGLSFGGEHVIKLRPGADDSFLENYRVLERFKNYALVEASPEDIDLLRILGYNQFVEYVSPNAELGALRVPNDPYYPEQWGLSLMGAQYAWDYRVDCSGVVVAVLDTGVDYNHSDLRANMWKNSKECTGTAGKDDDGNGYVDDCYGWDFVNNDNEPLDDNGHGTAITGILGAVGNNSLGVAGVCWKARIMPVKMLDGLGNGTALDFLKAVHYAVDNGAKVINASLGGDVDDPLLRDAVDYARSKGVVMVCAAGNQGRDNDVTPLYPASYSKSFSNVLSVASVDSDGSLSSFSNYGRDSVDLAAPGGKDGLKGVVSTSLGNGYSFGQGTSIATPFVSGAAAYIFSVKGDADASFVKGILLDSVVTNKELRDKLRSGGYISLYSIMRRLYPESGGCTSSGGSAYLLMTLFIALRLILPKLS